MAGRLEGKVAVVTGGGGGLGRAVARLLAAEGAAVVVNDLGTAVEGTGSSHEAADGTVAAIRAAGGRAVASYEDVADHQAAGRVIATAVEQLGRLDVLVTCAGIARGRMVFNLSEEEWEAVIATNLHGTFNCTRHACPLLRQQRGGRIVLMTSTAGLYGMPGQANLGAASDGIAGFTRVVSRDMGKYGVTVNAVAPEAATRMGEAVRPAGQAGREADPESVAAFVAYLASDAAAGINGQAFVVAGGLIALLNYPAPVRTLQRPERWTPADIAAVFPETLGLELASPAPARGG